MPRQKVWCGPVDMDYDLSDLGESDEDQPKAQQLSMHDDYAHAGSSQLPCGPAALIDDPVQCHSSSNITVVTDTAVTFLAGATVDSAADTDLNFIAGATNEGASDPVPYTGTPSTLLPERSGRCIELGNSQTKFNCPGFTPILSRTDSFKQLSPSGTYPMCLSSQLQGHTVVDGVANYDCSGVLHSPISSIHENAFGSVSFSKSPYTSPVQDSLARLFSEDEAPLTSERISEYHHSPRKRHEPDSIEDPFYENSLFVSAEDDNSSLFVSEEDNDDSLFGSARRNAECSEEEQREIKEEATAHSEEESGIPKVKKRFTRILQDPKILKRGVARPKTVMTQSDVDEKKILMDFNAWKQQEQIKKKGVITIDPVGMFYNLKDSIGSEVDEDDDAVHTVAQVVLMALSLGTTAAIVNLKGILEEMRGRSSQDKLTLLPANVVDELADEKLDVTTRQEREKQRRVSLTSLLMDSTYNGTPLRNFDLRYASTVLCEYIVARRDDLMREEPEWSSEDAMQAIYKQLILEINPKLKAHTRKKGKSRLESKAEELEEIVKGGLRWLALRKEFGMGIMAIHFYSELFSETSRLSVDDVITDVESEMFLQFILDRENRHNQWLHQLCRRINGYITDGAEGNIWLQRLHVENNIPAQIMVCQEHSKELDRMCKLDCFADKYLDPYEDCDFDFLMDV